MIGIQIHPTELVDNVMLYAIEFVEGHNCYLSTAASAEVNVSSEDLS